LRGEKPKVAKKKLSSANEELQLPVDVVRKLASNSYDTLIGLSAGLANKSDAQVRQKLTAATKPAAIAEKPKHLLIDGQNGAAAARRPKPHATRLHYETMRFPLAVFDVCAQQVPVANFSG
jgi:hypothetical protein